MFLLEGPKILGLGKPKVWYTEHLGIGNVTRFFETQFWLIDILGNLPSPRFSKDFLCQRKLPFSNETLFRKILGRCQFVFQEKECLKSLKITRLIPRKTLQTCQNTKNPKILQNPYLEVQDTVVDVTGYM